MTGENQSNNNEIIQRILKKSRMIHKTTYKVFEKGHSENIIFELNMDIKQLLEMLKDCITKYFNNMDKFHNFYDDKNRVKEEYILDENNSMECFDEVNFLFYGDNLILVDIRLREEEKLIVDNFALLRAIMEYTKNKEEKK